MAITESIAGEVQSAPGATDAAERCFVLWPHRSLPPAGFAILMACITLGVTLPLLRMPGGAAFWMVGLPCLSVPAAVALAYWCNNRAARIRELVTISTDQVRFVRTGPATRARIEIFNPYWVRLEVRSDRRVTNRILLAEGRRRIAIGDYLSPEERIALAAVLRAELRTVRTNGSSRRAPVASASA